MVKPVGQQCNTEYFTGNPPYSIPSYSLPIRSSASLQMWQGRGTDCRDGCSLINWSFPARF
jgi:hypothetical protein